MIDNIGKNPKIHSINKQCYFPQNILYLFFFFFLTYLNNNWIRICKSLYTYYNAFINSNDEFKLIVYKTSVYHLLNYLFNLTLIKFIFQRIQRYL